MTAVEVIVPVFNDQNRLNLLLNSLARQTLDPNLFAVTVVDNGSNILLLFLIVFPFSVS